MRVLLDKAKEDKLSKTDTSLSASICQDSSLNLGASKTSLATPSL